MMVPHPSPIPEVAIARRRMGPFDERLMQEMGGPFSGRGEVEFVTSTEFVVDPSAFHQTPRSEAGDRLFPRPG
ncbi:MAG: hypothetical protein RIT19_658 [Verrucomicrobiota bacterium]|jgi:hypothetical protein